MQILLTIAGDERVATTLADFLSENADGIDEAEAEAITETLRQGLVYEGGGGASVDWSVCHALDPSLCAVLS